MKHAMVGLALVSSLSLSLNAAPRVVPTQPTADELCVAQDAAKKDARKKKLMHRGLADGNESDDEASDENGSGDTESATSSTETASLTSDSSEEFTEPATPSMHGSDSDEERSAKDDAKECDAAPMMEAAPCTFDSN